MYWRLLCEYFEFEWTPLLQNQNLTWFFTHCLESTNKKTPQQPNQVRKTHNQLLSNNAIIKMQGLRPSNINHATFDNRKSHANPTFSQIASCYSLQLPSIYNCASFDSMLLMHIYPPHHKTHTHNMASINKASNCKVAMFKFKWVWWGICAKLGSDGYFSRACSCITWLHVLQTTKPHPNLHP